MSESEINTKDLNISSLSLKWTTSQDVKCEMINPSSDPLINYKKNSESPKNSEQLKIPLISLKSNYYSYENLSTQQSLNLDHQPSQKIYQEFKAPKQQLKDYRDNNRYYPQNTIHSFSIQLQQYTNESNQSQLNQNPWHIDCFKCLYYLGLIIFIVAVINYLFSIFFNAFNGSEQND